jgi:hypothetical protein
MKRIFSVLALMAVMAAMMVASAIPAFAAAPEGAGCVGRANSNTPPTTKGPAISAGAKLGFVAPEVTQAAHEPHDACDEGRLPT